MVKPVLCVHCGAIAKHPVTKMISGRLLSFCCGGCLQVYEMMHEEGEALADPVTSPAAPVGSLQTLTLPVSGMSCANCVATVERSLRKVSGVQQVSVSLANSAATLEIDPRLVDLDQLKQAVKKAGYRIP